MKFSLFLSRLSANTLGTGQMTSSQSLRLICLSVCMAASMMTACSNDSSSESAETDNKQEMVADETAKSQAAEAKGTDVKEGKAITLEDIIVGDNDDSVIQTLQANLKASGINAQILSAEPISVEGLYWVTAKGIPSFFTDKAGKHVIQGQIVIVGDGQPVDIGKKLDAKVNQKTLSEIAKEDMVIYPATSEAKGAIYVFTDTTCPYCQKFHEEIPELNKQGIEVRYLAWPRNKRAEPIMESVWCSEDRKSAMSAMQAQNKPENNGSPECKAIVKSQVELGHAMGVQGTPAIYTEQGEQIGGYLPANQVVKALKR